MSGFLASHFLPHSQISYGILANQLHCLHAKLYSETSCCSCRRIRSILLGVAVKVLKHSFLKSPNESFAECGGAAPLWPPVRKRFSISPLSHSKAHPWLIHLLSYFHPPEPCYPPIHQCLCRFLFITHFYTFKVWSRNRW